MAVLSDCSRSNMKAKAILSLFILQYSTTTTILSSVSSFTVVPTTTNTATITATTLRKKDELFPLYGRKKGNLSQNVTPGTVVKKKKKNTTKKNKKDEVVKVSSSLSQWAATQSADVSSTTSNSIRSTTTTTTKMDEDEDTSSSYQPFENDNVENTKTKKGSKKSKKSRRQRQTISQVQDTQKMQRVKLIISSINDILSENNFDVQMLLKLISNLVSIQSGVDGDNVQGGSGLKQLYGGKRNKLHNYNLAWVGSDDAICHLGTGLHKVPLARLQDIFMTIGGGGSDIDLDIGRMKKGSRGKGYYGGITIMEVISILGPFPNVRNTLKGSITDGKTKKSSSTSSDAFGGNINEQTKSDTIMEKGEQVLITYDSMTDGLGKEIEAGNDSNVRTVDLGILYADENAIVCIVPDVEDSDMFAKNGKNVMLFLKEEDLDGKLQSLRAA